MLHRPYYSFRQAATLGKKLAGKYLIVTDGSFNFTKADGSVNEGVKNQIRATTAAGIQYSLDHMPIDRRNDAVFVMVVNSQRSDTVVYKKNPATHIPEEERVMNALPI